MENEAEDDIDGALRDSGMGLLNEKESAGGKLFRDCGDGQGRGQREVRRRGRHQRQQEGVAAADQALQAMEGGAVSKRGADGGSKQCGRDVAGGGAEAGKKGSG